LQLVLYRLSRRSFRFLPLTQGLLLLLTSKCYLRLSQLLPQPVLLELHLTMAMSILQCLVMQSSTRL
jgi:hypothetical protein